MLCVDPSARALLLRRGGTHRRSCDAGRFPGSLTSGDRLLDAGAYRLLLLLLCFDELVSGEFRCRRIGV